MNKRQKKKWKKILRQRHAFLELCHFRTGRQCGKTLFAKMLYDVFTSKHYRPFKRFKKNTIRNLRRAKYSIYLHEYNSRQYYFEKIWR
jgi:hypothetical protein